jgi:uncharacterized membrane protein YfcA
MILHQPLNSFSLPSEVLVWQALCLSILSLGVGIIAGAVGLALGTIRLPFLLLFGMPAPVAAGTNILISTLSAISGSYRHLREGRVDFYVVAVQGIPGVIGAFIGGFGSGWVAERLLISAVALLLIWQAIELALQASKATRTSIAIPATQNETKGLARWNTGRIAAEAIVGLIVGLLGGAVGLILGTVRLPALIKILKIDPRIAAGSNLFIGVLMGGFGWLGHVIKGEVDYPILVLMGVTGMIGNYYGASWTGQLSVRNLLYLMSAVLAVVGFLLLRNAYPPH